MNCTVLIVMIINLFLDEKFLNLTTGGRGIITCENNLVISIERENIYTDQSYCSSDEIQCDSSGHDIRSQCNGLQNCTIDFPRNTSCMREDRYFNLSYLCLGNYIYLHYVNHS